MVIEDFAAKEMSTRICNMYDKWMKQDNLTENRKQIIEEIKNLPKPNPIVEFEVVFFAHLYKVFVCCLKNIFISNYQFIKIRVVTNIFIIFK